MQLHLRPRGFGSLACAALTLPLAAGQAPIRATGTARTPAGPPTAEKTRPAQAAPSQDRAATATERPVSPPVDAALTWADWSGDGLADVWASQPDGTGLLLENLGDGTFADRTESAGLSGVREIHQAAWADVDGDARLDLFLASWSGASRLFIQPSSGTFLDVTRTSGISAHARPVRAAWIDYDLDRQPDLHLVTLRGDVVYRGLGRARFETVDLGLLPRTGLVGPAAGSGGGTTMAAAGVGVSVTGTTAAAGGPASGICAGSIEDQATGACIQASSTPALGMLYPLSSDLFVAPTGRVGIGTTTPSERLTVNGNIRAARVQSTVATGLPPLVVASTTKVDNLNVDRIDGLDSSAFRLNSTPITGGDIVDGSITSSDIANSTITGADISDSSITGADIAAGSITGADIANSSLTGADVTDNSLTGADIQNGSIGTADLAAGSVSTAALALGAVGSAQIADGSIVDADVAPSAAVQGTKIVPEFGGRLVTGGNGADFNNGFVVGESTVRGNMTGLFARGYLGVAAGDDFDGILSADWNGLDIGVAGISTGGSSTDNYGVLGHSNLAGVRGEHSAAPLLNFGELGLDGVGIRARGVAAAAEFEGTVDVTSSTIGVDVSAGSATGDAMRVTNPDGGPAGRFISSTVGSTSVDPCLTANTQNRGAAALLIQSNPAALLPGIDLRTFGTGSSHVGIKVAKTGAVAGPAALFDVVSSTATGNAVEIENSGSGDGLEVASAGIAIDANRTTNTGMILVARNGSDTEFRVDSSGAVFCDGSFTGGGADYAEWLPVLDASERFAKGDVVGVHGGRISKRLDGADSLLVISTNPCLVGNNVDAETTSRDGHEVVAFLGQVPVRVRGRVRSGDLLVPSGNDDGTAIAVSPADLSPSQLGDVIGRAWDAAAGDGVHRVNCAIGLERDRIAALALGAVQAEVDELRASLGTVLERLERLESR